MKQYEKVKEKTLEEWVYFFTEPKLTQMPENARQRAYDAIDITLDKRHKDIFLRRYQDKATLEIIAKEMGLSKPRIHNILEASAVKLWESKAASVVLREGKEAGMVYLQKEMKKNSQYYFDLDIANALKNDSCKVIELLKRKKKKNVTTRLSRELGSYTIGEMVLFTKKQMDGVYGVGKKTKLFLAQMIEEYYAALMEEDVHG